MAIETLAIGGSNVTLDGDTIDFGTATIYENKLLQFSSALSVSEAGINKASQFVAIISLLEPTAIKAYQIVSIISISPGRPHRHSSIGIRSSGPLNLFKDMPVVGKRN